MADNEDGAATSPDSRKGTILAKTAAIGFVPATSLFARLIAAIDRALTASARASLRNGDLPRFGL